MTSFRKKVKSFLKRFSKGNFSEGHRKTLWKVPNKYENILKNLVDNFSTNCFLLRIKFRKQF